MGGGGGDSQRNKEGERERQEKMGIGHRTFEYTYIDGIQF